MITKPEIEKSILSTLMFDNDVYFKHHFRADMFTGQNQTLFESIKKIIESGGSADLPTIFESKCGLTASFISTVSDSPYSANIEYGISELTKASDLRNIFKTLTSATDMCKGFENVSKIESIVNKGFLNIVNDPVDHRKQMQDAFDNIQDIISGKKSIGIQTGIQGIDDIIGGIGKQKLVIIAGRPGDGKTSLAMNFVRNFCYLGYPGAIFSLEMSTEELTNRFICDIMSVDGSLIFQGRAKYLQKQDKSELSKKVQRGFEIIYDWPIVIDDRPRQTIDEIASQSRKHKATKNIQWIVIDHSREINGWNTEGQEIKSEIVSKCKALAKELDLPVILLSQLNREIEKRNKAIPKNSDLKDTGALEEKADIILFPVAQRGEGFTRDEMYREATIYITKNRGGNTGHTGKLKWQGHYYRYSDIFS